MGDSMVKWAARHALEVVQDMQLGVEESGAEITWKGKSGGYLTKMLPNLVQEVKNANRNLTL